MATTKELFKERMLIRKTDPERASVLRMLIDTVQKSIRELHRDEMPSDIANAAKKMYNETLASIADFRKGNGDTSELERELKILEEFLPATLSAAQMESEIRKIIDSLSPSDRTLKNIMPRLKGIEGIDMKAAREIVSGML